MAKTVVVKAHSKLSERQKGLAMAGCFLLFLTTFLSFPSCLFAAASELVDQTTMGTKADGNVGNGDDDEGFSFPAASSYSSGANEKTLASDDASLPAAGSSSSILPQSVNVHLLKNEMDGTANTNSNGAADGANKNNAENAMSVHSVETLLASEMDLLRAYQREQIGNLNNALKAALNKKTKTFVKKANTDAAANALKQKGVEEEEEEVSKADGSRSAGGEGDQTIATLGDSEGRGRGGGSSFSISVNGGNIVFGGGGGLLDGNNRIVINGMDIGAMVTSAMGGGAMNAIEDAAQEDDEPQPEQDTASASVGLTSTQRTALNALGLAEDQINSIDEALMRATESNGDNQEQDHASHDDVISDEALMEVLGIERSSSSSAVDDALAGALLSSLGGGVDAADGGAMDADTLLKALGLDAADLIDRFGAGGGLEIAGIEILNGDADGAAGGEGGADLKQLLGSDAKVEFRVLGLDGGDAHHDDGSLDSSSNVIISHNKEQEEEKRRAHDANMELLEKVKAILKLGEKEPDAAKSISAANNAGSSFSFSSSGSGGGGNTFSFSMTGGGSFSFGNGGLRIGGMNINSQDGEDNANEGLAAIEDGADHADDGSAEEPKSEDTDGESTNKKRKASKKKNKSGKKSKASEKKKYRNQALESARREWLVKLKDAHAAQDDSEGPFEEYMDEKQRQQHKKQQNGDGSSDGGGSSSDPSNFFERVIMPRVKRMRREEAKKQRAAGDGDTSSSVAPRKPVTALDAVNAYQQEFEAYMANERAKIGNERVATTTLPPPSMSSPSSVNSLVDEEKTTPPSLLSPCLKRLERTHRLVHFSLFGTVPSSSSSSIPTLANPMPKSIALLSSLATRLERDIASCAVALKGDDAKDGEEDERHNDAVAADEHVHANKRGQISLAKSLIDSIRATIDTQMKKANGEDIATAKPPSPPSPPTAADQLVDHSSSSGVSLSSASLRFTVSSARLASLCNHFFALTEGTASQVVEDDGSISRSNSRIPGIAANAIVLGKVTSSAMAAIAFDPLTNALIDEEALSTFVLTEAYVSECPQVRFAMRAEAAERHNVGEDSSSSSSLSSYAAFVQKAMAELHHFASVLAVEGGLGSRSNSMRCEGSNNGCSAIMIGDGDSAEVSAMAFLRLKEGANTAKDVLEERREAREGGTVTFKRNRRVSSRASVIALGQLSDISVPSSSRRRKGGEGSYTPPLLQTIAGIAPQSCVAMSSALREEGYKVRRLMGTPAAPFRIPSTLCNFEGRKGRGGGRRAAESTSLSSTPTAPSSSSFVESLSLLARSVGASSEQFHASTRHTRGFDIRSMGVDAQFHSDRFGSIVNAWLGDGDVHTQGWVREIGLPSWRRWAEERLLHWQHSTASGEVGEGEEVVEEPFRAAVVASALEASCRSVGCSLVAIQDYLVTAVGRMDPSLSKRAAHSSASIVPPPIAVVRTNYIDSLAQLLYAIPHPLLPTPSSTRPSSFSSSATHYWQQSLALAALDGGYFQDNDLRGMIRHAPIEAEDGDGKGGEEGDKEEGQYYDSEGNSISDPDGENANKDSQSGHAPPSASASMAYLPNAVSLMGSLAALDTVSQIDAEASAPSSSSFDPLTISVFVRRSSAAEEFAALFARMESVLKSDARDASQAKVEGSPSRDAEEELEKAVSGNKNNMNTNHAKPQAPPPDRDGLINAYVRSRVRFDAATDTFSGIPLAPPMPSSSSPSASDKSSTGEKNSKEPSSSPSSSSFSQPPLPTADDVKDLVDALQASNLLPLSALPSMDGPDGATSSTSTFPKDIAMIKSDLLIGLAGMYFSGDYDHVPKDLDRALCLAGAAMSSLGYEDDQRSVLARATYAEVEYVSAKEGEGSTRGFFSSSSSPSSSSTQGKIPSIKAGSVRDDIFYVQKELLPPPSPSSSVDDHFDADVAQTTGLYAFHDALVGVALRQPLPMSEEDRLQQEALHPTPSTSTSTRASGSHHRKSPHTTMPLEQLDLGIHCRHRDLLHWRLADDVAADRADYADNTALRQRTLLTILSDLESNSQPPTTAPNRAADPRTVTLSTYWVEAIGKLGGGVNGHIGGVAATKGGGEGEGAAEEEAKVLEAGAEGLVFSSAENIHMTKHGMLSYGELTTLAAAMSMVVSISIEQATVMRMPVFDEDAVKASTNAHHQKGKQAGPSSPPSSPSSPSIPSSLSIPLARALYYSLSCMSLQGYAIEKHAEYHLMLMAAASAKGVTRDEALLKPPPVPNVVSECAVLLAGLMANEALLPNSVLAKIVSRSRDVGTAVEEEAAAYLQQQQQQQQQQRGRGMGGEDEQEEEEALLSGRARQLAADKQKHSAVYADDDSLDDDASEDEESHIAADHLMRGDASYGDDGFGDDDGANAFVNIFEEHAFEEAMRRREQQHASKTTDSPLYSPSTREVSSFVDATLFIHVPYWNLCMRRAVDAEEEQIIAARAAEEGTPSASTSTSSSSSSPISQCRRLIAYHLAASAAATPDSVPRNGSTRVSLEARFKAEVEAQQLMAAQEEEGAEGNGKGGSGRRAAAGRELHRNRHMNAAGGAAGGINGEAAYAALMTEFAEAAEELSADAAKEGGAAGPPPPTDPDAIAKAILDEYVGSPLWLHDELLLHDINNDEPRDNSALRRHGAIQMGLMHMENARDPWWLPHVSDDGDDDKVGRINTIPYYYNLTAMAVFAEDGAAEGSAHLLSPPRRIGRHPASRYDASVVGSRLFIAEGTAPEESRAAAEALALEMLTNANGGLVTHFTTTVSGGGGNPSSAPARRFPSASVPTPIPLDLLQRFTALRNLQKNVGWLPTVEEKVEERKKLPTSGSSADESHLPAPTPPSLFEAQQYAIPVSYYHHVIDGVHDVFQVTTTTAADPAIPNPSLTSSRKSPLHHESYAQQGRARMSSGNIFDLLFPKGASLRSPSSNDVSDWVYDDGLREPTRAEREEVATMKELRETLLAAGVKPEEFFFLGPAGDAVGKRSFKSPTHDYTSSGEWTRPVENSENYIPIMGNDDESMAVMLLLSAHALHTSAVGSIPGLATGPAEDSVPASHPSDPYASFSVRAMVAAAHQESACLITDASHRLFAESTNPNDGNGRRVMPDWEAGGAGGTRAATMAKHYARTRLQQRVHIDALDLLSDYAYVSGEDAAVNARVPRHDDMGTAEEGTHIAASSRLRMLLFPMVVGYTIADTTVLTLIRSVLAFVRGVFVTARFLWHTHVMRAFTWYAPSSFYNVPSASFAEGNAEERAVLTAFIASAGLDTAPLLMSSSLSSQGGKRGSATKKARGGVNTSHIAALLEEAFTFHFDRYYQDMYYYGLLQSIARERNAVINATRAVLLPASFSSVSLWDVAKRMLHRRNIAQHGVLGRGGWSLSSTSLWWEAGEVIANPSPSTLVGMVSDDGEEHIAVSPSSCAWRDVSIFRLHQPMVVPTTTTTTTIIITDDDKASIVNATVFVAVNQGTIISRYFKPITELFEALLKDYAAGSGKGMVPVWGGGGWVSSALTAMTRTVTNLLAPAPLCDPYHHEKEAPLQKGQVITKDAVTARTSQGARPLQPSALPPAERHLANAFLKKVLLLPPRYDPCAMTVPSPLVPYSERRGVLQAPSPLYESLHPTTLATPFSTLHGGDANVTAFSSASVNGYGIERLGKGSWFGGMGSIAAASLAVSTTTADDDNGSKGPQLIFSTDAAVLRGAAAGASFMTTVANTITRLWLLAFFAPSTPWGQINDEVFNLRWSLLPSSSLLSSSVPSSLPHEGIAVPFGSNTIPATRPIAVSRAWVGAGKAIADADAEDVPMYWQRVGSATNGAEGSTTARTPFEQQWQASTVTTTGSDSNHHPVTDFIWSRYLPIVEMRAGLGRGQTFQTMNVSLSTSLPPPSSPSSSLASASVPLSSMLRRLLRLEQVASVMRSAQPEESSLLYPRVEKRHHQHALTREAEAERVADVRIPSADAVNRIERDIWLHLGQFDTTTLLPTREVMEMESGASAIFVSQFEKGGDEGGSDYDSLPHLLTASHSPRDMQLGVLYKAHREAAAASLRVADELIAEYSTRHTHRIAEETLSWRVDKEEGDDPKRPAGMMRLHLKTPTTALFSPNATHKDVLSGVADEGHEWAMRTVIEVLEALAANNHGNGDAAANEALDRHLSMPVRIEAKASGGIGVVALYAPSIITKTLDMLCGWAARLFSMPSLRTGRDLLFYSRLTHSATSCAEEAVAHTQQQQQQPQLNTVQWAHISLTVVSDKADGFGANASFVDWSRVLEAVASQTEDKMIKKEGSAKDAMDLPLLPPSITALSLKLHADSSLTAARASLGNAFAHYWACSGLGTGLLYTARTVSTSAFVEGTKREGLGGLEEGMPMVTDGDRMALRWSLADLSEEMGRYVDALAMRRPDRFRSMSRSPYSDVHYHFGDSQCLSDMAWLLDHTLMVEGDLRHGDDSLSERFGVSIEGIYEAREAAPASDDDEEEDEQGPTTSIVWQLVSIKVVPSESSSAKSSSSLKHTGTTFESFTKRHRLDMLFTTSAHTTTLLLPSLFTSAALSVAWSHQRYHGTARYVPPPAKMASSFEGWLLGPSRGRGEEEEDGGDDDEDLHDADHEEGDFVPSSASEGGALAYGDAPFKGFEAPSHGLYAAANNIKHRPRPLYVDAAVAGNNQPRRSPHSDHGENQRDKQHGTRRKSGAPQPDPSDPTLFRFRNPRPDATVYPPYSYGFTLVLDKDAVRAAKLERKANNIPLPRLVSEEEESNDLRPSPAPWPPRLGEGRAFFGHDGVLMKKAIDGYVSAAEWMQTWREWWG